MFQGWLVCLSHKVTRSESVSQEAHGLKVCWSSGNITDWLFVNLGLIPEPSNCEPESLWIEASAKLLLQLSKQVTWVTCLQERGESWNISQRSPLSHMKIRSFTKTFFSQWCSFSYRVWCAVEGPQMPARLLSKHRGVLISKVMQTSTQNSTHTVTLSDDLR